MRIIAPFVPVALSLVVATPLAAHSGAESRPRAPVDQQGDASVDSLRLAHADASQQVAALASARERTAAWAEERYRLISEIRGRGRGALRDALAAAQTAADSLVAIDQRLEAALASEEEARRALASALERRLELTVAAAERSEPRGRAPLLERARRLAAELAEVRRPPELPGTELPAVAIEPGDGPEEIALKADFLADRAAQFRSAAAAVTDEIARTQRREELREEMRRLVAEVRLFDQTGVPPTAAGAATGVNSESPTSEQGLDQIGEPPRGVATGEPLDLPLRSLEAGVPAGADPASAVQRLTLLRGELLRRAVALENQAEEFRGLLREGR